jgi:hypothetical protein
MVGTACIYLSAWTSKESAGLEKQTMQKDEGKWLDLRQNTKLDCVLASTIIHGELICQ